MRMIVEFCEYNRSNPDEDQIFRPQGSGDYLFLLLKTPMKVYLDEGLIVTKENACILYTPGYCQHYQAIHRFRNSYLHFTSEEPLEEWLEIPMNQIFYPENIAQIDEKIQELQTEYITKGLQTEAMCDVLIRQILILAARGEEGRAIRNRGEESLYQSFQQLRLEMLRHYEKPWTTEELCRRVNLEKSQFYAVYKKYFNSTPHGDLIQVRLDKAKNLLTNQGMPIQQVADFCGFSNVSHFCRYFKRQCGCSPGAWSVQKNQREDG